jgi:GDP-4-dehydro-6-deoxy-D-mannose reductase
MARRRERSSTMTKPRRVLITGITGFAGSHLAELVLAQSGVELFGIRRLRSRTENVEHLMDTIGWVECDLRDSASVKRMVKEIRPDWIFHLAAQSFVPSSWRAPEECFVTNVLGQLHLLEAVRDAELDASILIAGSSEEYGLVREDELPIRETNPLRPLSPYAVSKVAQDLLGYQFSRSYGLRIVRTRAFNHTGPRRGEMFATSDFARQIAAIEHGLGPPLLRVGNLEAIRDFTDVRDVVRGYWLALQAGQSGEVYNVCSGRGFRIAEVVDLLCGFANMTVTIVEDSARLRPSDVPILIGDSSRLLTATGWRPGILFEETLADLLDYWRERIGSRKSEPALATAS